MTTSAPETCLRMPRCHGIDIEECSISQLQDHLSKATFTSKELVQCYLRRIELINPRIKAIIETNPDALYIADRLDSERKEGRIRGLLHGIPFILKDNIATKDKMQTTAGSAALIGTVVSDDARIVTLLRESGAVLLAKANLSEFASMRASYYAEGYSSRGGQNRNPYNLECHPGGSSSGSASSVASNMGTFSIGTETDGSIMSPADRNAVVGIKPTLGLVSMLGVIPESPSMDTIGPFGCCIKDAAIVLDVIREERVLSFTDDNSLVSTLPNEVLPGSYTSRLSKKDGCLEWCEIWAALEEKRAGAQVFKVDFPHAEEIIPPNGWDWEFGNGETGSKLSEFQVVRTEFYNSLRLYLHKLEENKGNILSLEDVVAYNVQHTTQEGGVPGTHPAWPTGQDNFDKCLESKDWPEDDYLKALDYIRRKSREEGIDAALRYKGNTSKVYGLLVPLQADGGVACSVAAKAGYPMISIPIGVNDIGVPFGMGIIQTALKEHLLVKYGSAIENLVGGRKLLKFHNLDADNYPYVGTP
ncbi:hypothetical protein OCU04_005885 [Sclerotinia nivalis]|uniref:Amidase domain-containing protein n=1 Tax=Sclerotinia nivalis TaxID=352851 RepID=A0A9X0AQB4_9HELO|nr:hypothetical protein OCU04_005885 [Sclerotinia nivalis]